MKQHPVVSSWSRMLAVLAVLVSPLSLAAQNPSTAPALDPAAREAVITRLSEMLQQRYVYPEVATKANEEVMVRFKAGAFDQVTEALPFATMLTEALQSVTHDKHLRVRVRAPERARVEREDPALARTQAAARARGSELRI